MKGWSLGTGCALPRWGSEKNQFCAKNYAAALIVEIAMQLHVTSASEKVGGLSPVLKVGDLSPCLPPCSDAYAADGFCTFHRCSWSPLQPLSSLLYSKVQNGASLAALSSKLFVKRAGFVVIGRLYNYVLHCALSFAVQCIVIGPVCGFVCLWVCYHDNSKLRASIFTKLGL